LLTDVSPRPAGRAVTILAGARTFELDAGAAYFAASLPSAALLVVEDGFVVVRAALPGTSRPAITGDAGAGGVLLPPTSEESLCALATSRLTAISAEQLAELLTIPAVAESIVRNLTTTLRQKQEAIANLASTVHIERLRRKLLQLGRVYGHVARDGIRIDFPVTHALLAEMIGSSRETVTRALEELRRFGFVSRSGSTYRLLVPAETVFADQR
jgi:CRP-like cAMP-binding protein